MKRTTFDDDPCPIARSLSVLGERWTLLILREAYRGVRRFADFERELGIAKNVLSARLKALVESGVLDRTPSKDDARSIEYRLGRKARELFPVLMALALWGERWACDGKSPLRFRNRHSGAALAAVKVFDAEGIEVQARDVAMERVPADGAAAA
ncbi:winged helix-turn-helix transcriptional regulator [Chiayiivirga flava]|uniref:DNA-binding HxlR family transcriptional regulator n=1 Tax=Chiayiivirga flava TaxID=659595 RepID=A0A7W8D248_9GAMM|nr:helix-turn-helix domain-containing protein [Chiayiivirga flava]MBB5206575.1 DNA-binding HxlR family transcriptional regulator [Chiayiivirga flava]